MTKRRAPLTFEKALWTVAQLIGWARVAAIVGNSERTVRNWSDPDTSAGVTLDNALALDRAFAEAGGDGAPFHAVYSLRLDLDAREASAARDALIACAGLAAKEGGEAIGATIAAAHPDAGKAAFDAAERELEEAITTHTAALAAIRAGRGALVAGAGLAGRRHPTESELN